MFYNFAGSKDLFKIPVLRILLWHTEFETEFFSVLLNFNLLKSSLILIKVGDTRISPATENNNNNKINKLIHVFTRVSVSVH